ncbi:hypothetical protein BVJ53_12310 [Lacticaseibacillus chiayiensis]|uniref:Uncharacterized protein n=1 Tax=Lacticaseibacillus chiayiensis TaxID=2100821 RepID=A0A4Q1TM84_9LACO|nr:hypothetical protein [Lacticaseibacillus chiayiensis]QVI35527.1 hypothetical protein KG086_04295 [Lacticaseibacillus chiayiensis]RXT18998.1 hypothetical protein BVJ53_12310 [Lacticaseibacillus chiayiensis]UYN57366.1 hypothetical protein OFW50_04665 [Lacticaseibacillus chiayiensis]
MKLRGSVFVNTLILFGFFLTLTVGLFEHFKLWQQRYQVIAKVEKAQFEAAYLRWRQQAEATSQATEEVPTDKTVSSSDITESNTSTNEASQPSEIKTSKAEMLE